MKLPNLRHIERDHPERRISRDNVTEALNDPQRVESAQELGRVMYYTVIATRAGMPYQTFMKSVLEAGVAQLERRSNSTRRAKQASARYEAR